MWPMYLVSLMRISKKIERTLNVTVVLRGESMKLLGEEHNLKKAEQVFLQLIELSKRGNIITEQNVNYALALSEEEKESAIVEIDKDCILPYDQTASRSNQRHLDRKHMWMRYARK